MPESTCCLPENLSLIPPRPHQVAQHHFRSRDLMHSSGFQRHIQTYTKLHIEINLYRKKTGKYHRNRLYRMAYIVLCVCVYLNKCGHVRFQSYGSKKETCWVRKLSMCQMSFHNERANQPTGPPPGLAHIPIPLLLSFTLGGHFQAHRIS